MDEWLSLESNHGAKRYVYDTENSCWTSQGMERLVWVETVKETQALNRVGRIQTLRDGLGEKPAGGDNAVCGRTKNSFLFSAGLKHLYFQYLESP